MKFPDFLRVVGDTNWRGKCPPELTEQITFFNWLARQYPALHAIAVHPPNAGKRTYQQAQRMRVEGSLNTGASDVIIPCTPAIVIEMKRRDHTQSRWQDGQIKYLKAAQKAGARVCVALGWEAAAAFVKECVNAPTR